MVKNILFYLSILPMTVIILSAVILAGMLVATGGAAVILGIAHAMVPAPTGI